jgi:hypothetical protein
LRVAVQDEASPITDTSQTNRPPIGLIGGRCTQKALGSLTGRHSALPEIESLSGANVTQEQINLFLEEIAAP